MPRRPRDRRKVFVVHGRDPRYRSAMFDFLKSLGLEPLEWEDAVRLTGSASPFTAEVVAKGIQVAQAIVVLLTGDDEARLREEFRRPGDASSETELTRQARPNVLFEAGMAFARANQRHTIIVEMGRLRGLSDTTGISVIRFRGSETDRRAVLERLRTAGCAVDDTGNWRTAGNFTVTPEASEEVAPVPEPPARVDTVQPPGAYALRANANGAWLNIVVQANPAVARRTSSVHRQAIDSICQYLGFSRAQVDADASARGIEVTFPQGASPGDIRVQFVGDPEFGQAVLGARSAAARIHIAWVLARLGQLLPLALSEAAGKFMDFSQGATLWVSLSNWPDEGIETDGLFVATRAGQRRMRGFTYDFASATTGSLSQDEIWRLAQRFGEEVLMDAGFMDFEDALAATTLEACLHWL